jgi:DnaJ-class molecular chaperone
MSSGVAGGEERGTCTPCRGTGRLLSALGGHSHEVTCPWCRGSGRFTPGEDAQTHPAEGPDPPPTPDAA